MLRRQAQGPQQGGGGWRFERGGDIVEPQRVLTDVDVGGDLPAGRADRAPRRRRDRAGLHPERRQLRGEQGEEHGHHPAAEPPRHDAGPEHEQQRDRRSA